ncbi:ABC-three component system middle component 2, partial [Frankia sp. Cj3]|uniref:ABC-three component system middle component 2 n=1 Tax=Frankia sp. Cj3 TaxID=2880976 RepID=UPI001EF67ED9
LLLLDYGLLHSADLDGPPSLHPAIPVRPGELGIKRSLIEEGLRVVRRAGLAEISFEQNGIHYRSTDRALSFLNLLESPYAQSLKERSSWVAESLVPLGPDQLRQRMRQIFDRWSEEFDVAARFQADYGDFS